jgi:two-component system OmpR family response regulator
VDGLVFCTQLRAEAPDVPFMICGAATTAEKVLAFKLGAEDVLAKPFELGELEARIEVILRRQARRCTCQQQQSQPHAAPTPLHGEPNLGRLRVDLAGSRVLLDARPLDLTPTEYQLLVFMSRRAGEIISREELASCVWGDESMARSRTIDAYVRRVSAKLHGPGAPRILRIHGLGYQLAAPFLTAA